MDNYEVRCPNQREHEINGITYGNCGYLLGGIGDGVATFRCPVCKVFWEVTFKEDEMAFKKLDGGKKKRINFKKHWRTVNV